MIQHILDEADYFDSVIYEQEADWEAWIQRKNDTLPVALHIGDMLLVTQEMKEHRPHQWAVDTGDVVRIDSLSKESVTYDAGGIYGYIDWEVAGNMRLAYLTKTP